MGDDKANINKQEKGNMPQRIIRFSGRILQSPTISDLFNNKKTLINSEFQNKGKIKAIKNHRSICYFKIKTYFCIRNSGCSSARLEYASGGRVVAGSNPVTPTGKNEGVK